MEFMQQEGDDIKSIFLRFKKRDFSGNAGQAIKNSSYHFTTTITAKIGSLIFTIVLARMLMPELFGLYSLALATTIIFSSFSDLGLGTAMIAFVSKSLAKKKPNKAKAYFEELLKYKIFFVWITSGLLILSSYFIANFYYSKPIFYALLVGGLYIPVVALVGYLNSVFQAVNSFRHPLFREIFFQLLRLTLVPIGIL